MVAGESGNVESQNFHHFVALFAQKRARSLRQTDSAATPPPTQRRKGSAGDAGFDSPSPKPPAWPTSSGAEASGAPPVAWFTPNVAVTLGVPSAWFVAKVGDGSIFPLVSSPIHDAFQVRMDINVGGMAIRIHNISLEARVGRSSALEEAMATKWDTTALQ